MADTENALAEIEAAMRDMESLAKPSGKQSAKPSKSPRQAPQATKPKRTSRRSKARTSHPTQPDTGPRLRRARNRTPDTRSRRRSKGPLHHRILAFLVGLIVAIVLPFYVLLRGSVYLYQEFAVWPWLAITGGAAATAILLMLYVAWIGWRLGSGFKFSKGAARGLVVLLALFVGYTAMYVSAGNVKSPEIQETYTSLHPLLRLATSTFILIDSDVVITDGERRLEDYAAMGLPANERSLHFRQEDTGYAHAVDLRTIGREEWQNFLMTAYFKLTGFETLRHTGTADHLHVSLPT